MNIQIPAKHAEKIITALDYSIHHIREHHRREAVKWRQERGEPYYYDYEKYSIEPLKDAVDAVRTAKANIKK